MAFNIPNQRHASEEEAERMGFDAGFNGSDTANCHFRYFATEALRDAWERGQTRGLNKAPSAAGDADK